jgi:hypothetical protein
MDRSCGRLMAAGACVAVLMLVSGRAAGQALYPRDVPKQPGAPSWALERAKLPPFTPPRTPEGTPDLQGRWGGPSGGDDIEEHDYVDVSSPPEETYIADPPGGRIPYQPWAKAVQAEHRAGLARGWPGEKERLYPDPQTFCLYSVPRATYRGGFEIVQVPGYVVILYGFNHYYRFIPTDGRPHDVAPHVKLWMGNSRGSWQGNTLVVDVTNLNGKNWLDQVGNFFSDHARVVERFTLADANTIDYEAAIDDPKVFTRPWTIRVPLRRTRAAAGDRYANETWENACYEGNHAPEHNRILGYKWFRGVTPPPQ